MRPAQAARFFFPKPENRGHKKAFDLPQGEETKAGRRQQKRRRDSTPILSVARQSPGPHSPGLDERKKAGLLTSGSSYSLRLTARLRAVASWSFRRPLQRRYRTGFTPVSLFSPAFDRGTFLRVGSDESGPLSKNWSVDTLPRWPRQVNIFAMDRFRSRAAPKSSRLKRRFRQCDIRARR